MRSSTGDRAQSGHDSGAIAEFGLAHRTHAEAGTPELLFSRSISQHSSRCSSACYSERAPRRRGNVTRFRNASAALD